MTVAEWQESVGARDDGAIVAELERQSLKQCIAESAVAAQCTMVQRSAEQQQHSNIRGLMQISNKGSFNFKVHPDWLVCQDLGCLSIA